MWWNFQPFDLIQPKVSFSRSATYVQTFCFRLFHLIHSKISFSHPAVQPICFLSVHLPCIQVQQSLFLFIIIIIIIVKILHNFCEYNPMLGSMTGHFLHLISLVTQEKEANLTDSDF